MQGFIYCKITCFGCHRTHHQEYMKPQMQLLVLIMLSGQKPSASSAYRPRWLMVVALIT